MENSEKPFDPHSLLPKEHPLHPEKSHPEEKHLPDEAQKHEGSSEEAKKPITVTVKKNSRIKLVVSLLGGFVIVILILLFISGYVRNLPVLSSLSPLSPVSSQALPSGKISEGKNEWQLYVSPESGFSMKHPLNVTPSVFHEGGQTITVFTLVGPTQKENTEFYDGISLQFTSGELSGETLEEVVKKDSTDMSKHADITREIEPVTVSGIHGFTYSASGLGDISFIYLPDGGAYLKITNLTKDPSNQGYEKIVTDMLQTLQFTAEGIEPQ